MLIESEQLPVAQHVAAFSDYLKGKGSTARHINSTLSNIFEIIHYCGFGTGGDFDAGKVSRYLADLRRQDKGVQAINHRLTAFKSFVRWLFITDRIRSDSMKSLKRDVAGERVDRRHPRRALADVEIRDLIEAAEQGPQYMSMSGPDRAMLYRLALGTGLRASELRSLTPGSFALDDPKNPTVNVQAAYSKHRRDDVQPMNRELAEAMAGFIVDKPVDDRLFKIPSRAFAMIKADLEAAGISYCTAAGYADFHALRHTFITQLARSGVAPAVAMSLARHSSITLTMDRYTHVVLSDQRSALERLPALQTVDTCKLGGEDRNRRSA